MKAARLVLPALRWRADTGFAAEGPTIERGLGLGVGGFIVFGGTIESVTDLTESLLEQAGRPLLIGADLERGPGQQVAGLVELPPPAALASLGDQGVVQRAGAVTGAEARSVGINWIFAPDADLDLVAANPIVQTRSFGGDPAAVGAAVSAWIDGCQSAGALACAKHYPGHGRTQIDPHDRLPTVDASAAELAADLVPFRSAIAHHVASIMTAHVGFPALDPSGRPATLSPTVLATLRGQLGFAGAIVSDAMMMGALREGWAPGEAGVLALEAGVDLLLYPDEPWETIAAIERAMAAQPAVRRRVDEASGRYQRLLAQVDRPGAVADRAADARFADLTADRLMAASDLSGLRLIPPIEIVIVDDDQDGAYPASPNHYVADRLTEAGVALGKGGSVVVLALAEPRASKGRAGFGPASRALLEAIGGRAALVALFAHPRLAAELPAGVPVLQAWHRQQLMQDAAARAMLARVR